LPAAAFHIYSGNTHAHTSNTWSHGDQFINTKKEADEPKETLTVSAEGVQSPPKGKVVKPDWLKHQGAPAQHYAIARTNAIGKVLTSLARCDFVGVSWAALKFNLAVGNGSRLLIAGDPHRRQERSTP